MSSNMSQFNMTAPLGCICILYLKIFPANLNNILVNLLLLESFLMKLVITPHYSAVQCSGKYALYRKTNLRWWYVCRGVGLQCMYTCHTQHFTDIVNQAFPLENIDRVGLWLTNQSFSHCGSIESHFLASFVTLTEKTKTKPSLSWQRPTWKLDTSS